MISFNRKNQIRTGVNDISYVIFYIDLTKRKLLPGPSGPGNLEELKKFRYGLRHFEISEHCG